MKRQPYTAWELSEKLHLKQLAESNIQDGKVNWNLVAGAFPGRTKQQVKSMYMNTLRQTSTIQLVNDSHTKENSKSTPISHQTIAQWDAHSRAKLFHTSQFYNYDWAFVQQSYYPDFTVDELQYLYQELEEDFSKFSSLLITFQNWTNEELNIEVHQAHQIHNDVAVLLYKFQKYYTQDPDENCQYPSLYPRVLTLLDPNYYDLIEKKTVAKVNESFDLQLILQNVRRYIEEGRGK